MKSKWLFLGALISSLFYSGILFAMLADRLSILSNGQEVVLKTVPVDPRDLLRGRYVRLNFDISSVKKTNLRSGFASLESAIDDLFIILKENSDGKAEVVDIVEQIPQSLVNGEIAIRADISGTTQATFRLKYNLERFYLPEHVAPEIEKLYRDQKVPMDVVIAVNDSGRAQIKSLLIDGKVAYEVPLF